MPNVETAFRTTLALTYLEPCCLCAGKADAVGVFEPAAAEAEKYCVPPRKQRLIFYPICDSCRREPGALERIETVLQRGAYRLLRSGS